jgi:hypothetical protein
MAGLVCREVNLLTKMSCFKKSEKHGGRECSRSINVDIEVSRYYEFSRRGVEVVNEFG